MLFIVFLDYTSSLALLLLPKLLQEEWTKLFRFQDDEDSFHKIETDIYEDEFDYDAILEERIYRIKVVDITLGQCKSFVTAEACLLGCNEDWGVFRAPQTCKMELFAKIVDGLKAINYFRKKLHPTGLQQSKCASGPRSD